MSRLAKTFATLAVAAVLAGLSYAHLAAQGAQKKDQPPPPPPPKAAHVMVTPDKVTWGPAPPALPPGAQAAVLEGDPTTTGLFVVRVKFPDGYRVPPHSHPTDTNT